MRLHHSPPAKGLACVRTLSRIHPALSNDPFAPLKGVLAGAPQPLGFKCGCCRKPIRRGFTQSQLTGFEFSFVACGCTGLSRFAELGDPTTEEWVNIVAEADRLMPGQVKVHAKVIDELPDAGGPS